MHPGKIENSIFSANSSPT